MIFFRDGSVFTFKQNKEVLQVAIAEPVRREQFDQLARLAQRAKLTMNELKNEIADFIERNSY